MDDEDPVADLVGPVDPVGGRDVDGLGDPQQVPPPPIPERQTTTGRVLATITVLEGTVHIAGVDVELVQLDGNVVLAKTISDLAGQANFPDVPAGRYFIRATRPGFEPTESAPFDVRAFLTDIVPNAQYIGSLTTPPCTEGVHWVVLLSPATVTTEHLAQFHERIHFNARPVQRSLP